MSSTLGANMISKNGKVFQKMVMLDGKQYSVTRPLNSWDMNYHFIDSNNNDYLVDLQDVCDHLEKTGATLEDAIAYAKDMIEQGLQFYWLVR